MPHNILQTPTSPSAEVTEKAKEIAEKQKRAKAYTYKRCNTRPTIFKVGDWVSDLVPKSLAQSSLFVHTT